MDDLISRQAAIERIDEALGRVIKGPCGEKILARVPSAQPEIIRCRECKYWVDNDGFNHEHGAECSMMRMWMQPGDYCSYAKRREVSE